MGNEITTRQPQHTFADLTRMAEAVAKSGLFGVKTPEAALTLMLIAQEEGTGVAAACRDFHVIEGKPSLRVDAMLARFQASGGKVEWHEMSEQKVEATFSHPASSPLKLAWTWEMAVRAKLHTKDNWAKYPRAMLRSRVVSEGIRAVSPGSIVGVYTPEELLDGEGELRDITPRGEKSSESVRKPEVPIDVDTTTGEIKTAHAPQTEAEQESQMDPGAVADHLAAIEAAATLDDLKTAHSKAYTAAHMAKDGKALLKLEVARKTAKYKLTKDAVK